MPQCGCGWPLYLKDIDDRSKGYECLNKDHDRMIKDGA